MNWNIWMGIEYLKVQKIVFETQKNIGLNWNLRRIHKYSNENWILFFWILSISQIDVDLLST